MNQMITTLRHEMDTLWDLYADCYAQQIDSDLARKAYDNAQKVWNTAVINELKKQMDDAAEQVEIAANAIIKANNDDDLYHARHHFHEMYTQHGHAALAYRERK